MRQAYDYRQEVEGYGVSRLTQKNKSDNMTHLHWKTILMKKNMQKGDDGKITGTFF